MIDGFKILVRSYVAQKWLSNKLLRFGAFVSVETSGLLGSTLVAKYQSLEFRIFFDEEGIVKSGLVLGSLHKYFNKGKYNYNDFTFLDLQTVIKELETVFNIEPETSVIQNLEFGVNIQTPVTAKEILKNLVAFKNKGFSYFDVKRKRLGKSVTHQQSKLKIYDKGKTEKLGDNLLRFEMKALKNAYLKRYDIKTLQDLTEISKIQALAVALVGFWDDVIYHDKIINYRALTEHQQKKYLYWATPRNWEDYNHKERYKQKQRYKKLVKKHGASTYADIKILLSQKAKELTAEKGGQINQVLTAETKHKKGDKLTEYVNGYLIPKSTLKNKPIFLPIITTKRSNKKAQKKVTKKRRGCMVCKKDITEKKATAKYCSKACNNKCNGMKRTQKNKRRILAEKENLQKILKALPKKKLWLMVSYKTDSGIYTDTLKQTEITTSKDWIRKTQKVLITGYRKNAPPIILTSYRTRKLLNEINNQNLQDYETGK
ncbi:hypothetical protein [Tenacibaculum maritimum]|uniref:hypothetical protein n=1 Tax=Tenacibaculum maritimum TaxID=107401 RepID=UPI00387715E2